MKTADIRSKFLSYFADKKHEVVPSAPLVPFDDPTLLFINAGMNPFKSIFLGQTEVSYKRATSSQKCLRVGGKHNDLDQVGHTARHLTFFEMLGNFSFGDYFKKDAIDFAFDATLNTFNIDIEKLWITVYEDDEEALELWKAYVKPERIVKLGAKSNFWSMGDTGPCGPCSELHYDLGPEYGDAEHLKDDPEGNRYFEFWNLVFMQYNQSADGKRSKLPRPSVDTGMGLERMAMLQQNAKTVFDTDIFTRLNTEIAKHTKVPYEGAAKPAYHVIGDHLRALSFAISDGAQPGNVERGYVLRKIVRRAVRYARQLQIEKPFMGQLLGALVEEMGEAYPQLQKDQTRIADLITQEEESFIRTLRRGGNILGNIIKEAKTSKKQQISGKDAFTLKDTYGFPLEEIVLLANDHQLSVNMDAYQILEEKAKELSKQSRTVKGQEVSDELYREFVKKHGETVFTGYASTEDRGSILGILVDGELVETLEEGQEGAILLDQTSFYAEMGGQVGDRGELEHHKALFTVTDCTTPYPGVVLHKGIVKRGVLCAGEPVDTLVNKELRQKIRVNHTATHLLHWALEQVLGSHIRQGGSYVGPSSFRFDFSHHKAVDQKQLRQIEELMNAEIAKSLPIKIEEVPYTEVKEREEIKQFFGDKYGDKVRVVSIGNISHELCGGTHAVSVGEILLFRITSESSIGSGMRRIEGVTREAAYGYMWQREDLLLGSAERLGVSVSKLHQALDTQIAREKEQKQALKRLRDGQMARMAHELVAKKHAVDGVSIVCETVDIERGDLVPFSNQVMANLGSGILCLAVLLGDKCHVLLRVSPDLVKEGYSAREYLDALSPIVGGKGGGNPQMAQAGGTLPDQIPAFFEGVKEKLCAR